MRHYFPYPKPASAVSALHDLSEAEFGTLRDELRGSSAFDYSLARCVGLSKALCARRTPAELFELIHTLSFLYDAAREWDRDKQDRLSELLKLIEFTGRPDGLSEDAERVGLARTLELVAKIDDVERQRKLQRLRTGLLPTASQFASFIDLRPRYSESRDKVLEFVPIVLFQIALESDVEEQRSAVFQVNLDGLAALRGLLDDIDAKLAALVADQSIRDRLADTPVSKSATQ